ncbi:MAG: hypothetical protein KJT03_18680 [Verrucomicrobiae bacterium]|nr:hypothetical protein [Verrucomicrobiae bacterium]
MAENPNSSLPKWPFLAGDLILVILACFIVIASPKPMSAINIFACALSVLLGMLIFVTPYLIEHFTLQQNLKLTQAKAGETLLKANQLSESLLRRTESLHAEVMKAVLAAKQLPSLIEDKSEIILQSLNADSLAATVSELEELLLKYEALDLPDPSQQANTGKEIGKQITKLRMDLKSELEAISKKMTEAIQQVKAELAERLDQIKSTEPTAIIPDLEPATAAEEDEADQEEESEEISNSDSEPEPDDAIEENEEDETWEESEELFEEDEEPEEVKEEDEVEENDYILELDPDPDADEAMDTSRPSKSSAVSQNEDGATRLIVGAFIGISNKLYIRGDGPGLSWDKGVPMELVGIGKWEWKTYKATSTVHCKVLINDEQWTDSEDYEIDPNTTTEATAAF